MPSVHHSIPMYDTALQQQYTAVLMCTSLACQALTRYHTYSTQQTDTGTAVSLYYSSNCLTHMYIHLYLVYTYIRVYDDASTIMKGNNKNHVLQHPVVKDLPSFLPLPTLFHPERAESASDNATFWWCVVPDILHTYMGCCAYILLHQQREQQQTAMLSVCDIVDASKGM